MKIMVMRSWILTSLLAPAAWGTALSGVLADWNVSLPGLPEFEVKINKKSGKAPAEIHEISAKGKAGRYLQLTRITGLDAAAAARYAADRKVEIESIYERHFDGYFPSTAKGHSCPSKMKPVRKILKTKSTEADALLYHASARQVPVCLKEEATQRAIALFAYCPAQKEMVSVRYFQPAGDYSDREEKAILSFQCAIQP
jgi:hypothetical protein